MVKRGDPQALRLVVRFLRSLTGMTQEDFAGALGLVQSTISDYEHGVVAAPVETLRRMADLADVPWAVVVGLRRFYAAALALSARGGAGRGDRVFSAVRPLVQEILDVVLLAVAPYLLEEAKREAEAASPPAAARLAEAAEAWSALAGFPPARRRRLIELSPDLAGNCALARVICDASESAAGDDAGVARELAELALFVARQVPGEAERARTVGFCRAFLANAFRVATDFAAADRELRRAWLDWEAGGKVDRTILPKWRLHDLEASLRRAQRRFPAALKCIEWAFALCDREPAAAGRILLKKEHIYDAMGDPRRALEALAEAAPFVEAVGDPHQLFALRFNQIHHLVHLERFAEATGQLPAVVEMATAQDRTLDKIRVVWLAARIAAGKGRTDEAIAGFEQVREDFLTHNLPYEAALVSLDLALLLLQLGRLAAVKTLALTMGEIFEAKGIAPEALAAFTLFCEAAQREAATVELTKRVIGEMEQARR